MANWTTEWITHPDYPGWRKRRLVDPRSGMQAMLQTFWERIPGSDPNLPGPPGSERGGNPFLPPSWKRPDFGKFPKLPPGKPYRPPSGTHEMPGIPDGFNPFLRPSPYRPPSPKWPPRIKPVPFPKIEQDPDRVRPVPMPNIDPWANLPEYDPESKWYNPNWREDMERERGLPPGHLVHLVPPSQSERMREQFNLGGNFGDNNFSKLIKDAQVGSAMGRTRGLRRENMMIPPPMRKRYPAEFDPATGQNRVVPGTLRTTYPRPTGPSRGAVDTFPKLGGQGRYAGLPEGTYLPWTEEHQGPGVVGEFDTWARDDWSWTPKEAAEWGADAPYVPGQPTQIQPPAGRETDIIYSKPSGEYLRERMRGKQRISDLPLRSATQGDSMSDHLAATYGEDSPELRRHEAQDAGIELPKGKDWITKMHDIQSAYFTGADFGYEEFWPQRLGVTNEMIDMFMAVPEEALQYAMDNPTDAVLQEFEEYYGFPLNVNDPDMQKYFGDRKKKR